MSKSISSRDLTHKQQLFVREYCVDKNATQAAKRAGYSANSAYSIGQENLKKPVIRSAIAIYLDLACSEMDITQERILLEESRIAFADIAELVRRSNGSPLPPNELPEDIRRAVASYEQREILDRDGEVKQRIHKYKLNDKGAALFRLEKTQGLIIDKIQIDLTATLELVARIIAEECQPEQIERIGGRLSEIGALGVSI